MTGAGPQRPPGLAGSLARLARTALGVLRTRLEILATEIEEERIRFAGLALVVAAIAFCVQMAVLLFVILMVVLLWESHRVVTLGTLSGAFLVCGVVLYFWLRRRLRTRPRMFASTLGELGKDDERLGRGGGRG